AEASDPVDVVHSNRIRRQARQRRGFSPRIGARGRLARTQARPSRPCRQVRNQGGRRAPAIASEQTGELSNRYAGAETSQESASLRAARALVSDAAKRHVVPQRN